MIVTQIQTFLCPSDPGLGASGQYNFGSGNRTAGTFSYPNNMGLNRHLNNWRPNGPSYVASNWDDALKSVVNLSTFVDGTSNTAVFSEWVKGPAVPAPDAKDGLGVVYLAGFNSDKYQGQVNADWLQAQDCQNLGRTRNWMWKGEWWVYGTTAFYTNTQVPNRRSCYHDNVIGDRATNMISASSFHPGGVNVGFGDGSVKFIKNSINFAPWHAVATPNGGEVISTDAF